MGVDQFHPDYETYLPYWTMMRDCDDGELTVKDKGVEYLPMPSGFTGQKDGGTEFYNAYRMRAQFPDILMPTHEGMVGVIHRVEADIQGLEENKPLAKLWEKATKDGLPLEAFHRKITSELLLMGRYSILTDVPSEPKPGEDVPYLVGYGAEMLINWNEFERDLFVLDESRKVRGDTGQDEFSWTDSKRYRVLRLKGGTYSQQVYGEDNKNTAPGEEFTPQLRGGKGMTEIPLVVVGPRNVSFDYVPPPLLGVAKSALAIYRLDADYRHQLFHSGQETLFVIGDGIENPIKLYGSGCTYTLPGNSDAKFVGPSGVGIGAHRTAIMDERSNAVAAGVKLFDTQKQAESGEALRLRAAAQTATLTTVAIASAQALEKALRNAALFVGQNPEEIVVKPNLKFVEQAMTPREAADLVSVWQSGAISKMTLYENLQRGEIASQERTFEEEEEQIAEEQIDMPLSPEMAAGGQGFAQPQGGGAVPGGNPRARRMNGAAPAGAPPADRFVEDGEGVVFENA